jgi:hypothetical protein
MKCFATINIVLIVVIILYFLYTVRYKEGMIDTRRSLNTRECPNKILHKKDGIYLYNLRKPIIPGTNPLKFKHLDEYIDFINVLREKNIRCPILYYTETSTREDFEMIPSLSNMMPYLPQKINLYDAGEDPNSIYNKNMTASYDPLDQYNGSITPLDKINPKFSKDNSMDDKWKGRQHTQRSVSQGNYEDDDVFIRINRD